jgi:hypothetical protein
MAVVCDASRAEVCRQRVLGLRSVGSEFSSEKRPSVVPSVSVDRVRAVPESSARQHSLFLALGFVGKYLFIIKRLG